MVELVWDLAWELVNTPLAASLPATAVTTVTTPAPAPAPVLGPVRTISTRALPTISLRPELSGSEVPARATTGLAWSSRAVTWVRWDTTWDRCQAGSTRTSSLEVLEVEVEDTRACQVVEAAVPAWSTPAIPS